MRIKMWKNVKKTKLKMERWENKKSTKLENG